LIQQHFGSHSVWGAYGNASPGSCSASSIPAPPCSTLGLGAYYISGGYLYSFNEGSGIFAAGYGMFNDFAARYSPFPYIDSRENTNRFLGNILEVAPGGDTIGFGIGFVHQFTAKLLGGGGEDPAKAMAVKQVPAEQPTATASEEEEAPEPEGEPASAEADDGEAPPNVELEEEAADEAPAEE
jgi:hypothetical protein